jgi:hypothetical protein
MIKISTIFVFGILVALVPYSGFPSSTKTFLYVFFGVLIAILSLLIRRELHEVLRVLHGEEKNDTFSQSEPKGKKSI